MADIFLSYASEDRSKAERLSSQLEDQGWSVWWDRTIQGGQPYDEVIEKALDSARCVLVLWSEISVNKDWVKTEALEALDRKILIPVLIESVKIPLAFRRFQAVDLINWDSSDPSDSFRQLVNDIVRLLGPSPKKTGKIKHSESKVKGKVERELRIQEKKSATITPVPNSASGESPKKTLLISIAIGVAIVIAFIIYSYKGGYLEFLETESGLTGNETDSTIIITSERPIYTLVLDFKGIGVSGSEAQIITNRVRTLLFQFEHHEVIDPDLVKLIAREQDFLLGICIDFECAVEIGRMVGAQQVFTGSIGKIGTVYTIDMKVFNIETGHALHTTSFDYKGSIENFLTEGIPIAVRRIAGME